MIKLLKYNLNSEFESNKELLNQLNHYVALTKDNQMVHLKPPFKGLIINTNNTGTTINKRTDSGFETITLENGENKFTDWNYGFYFNGGMKQTQITSFDLSKYDTSNVNNMESMFTDCSGLTSLDVSSFDTSKVNNMSWMFRSCGGLTSLAVTNFDTSKVTNMDYMFSDCSGLTSLDLSKFNTSMVTSMSNMFSFCSGLTSLDLSNFDTTKVIAMIEMFRSCNSLTTLDLSSFDTSNVTYMKDMFRYCNSLTHIKCKQAFKNWCITNQDTIKLPTAMRNGGGGTWDIVQ